MGRYVFFNRPFTPHPYVIFVYTRAWRLFQYIIQLVLCVLTLLAMTGVFIASVILVRYYTAEYDTTGCQTIYGTCVCRWVITWPLQVKWHFVCCFENCYLDTFFLY